jgi:glycosyltransferase involved in cell wall biosynthesis
MSRMRVLQVVPSLTTGGAQRVAMDLAEHLDHQQFEVELVSLSPATGEIFESDVKKMGVNAHYLMKRTGLDVKIFGEVYRTVSKFKPQVIHNHLHALYTLLPSSLICGTPVRIHTIHSIANQEAQGLHRLIQKIAFLKLGVVPVSISQTVWETVREVYGKIDSPIIHNGIDLEKYLLPECERITWWEQFGILENAFVFINVASFGPLKNQRLLVLAFKDVLRYFPSSVLLLVGDGELRQEISSLVNQMGISKQVIFTGIRSDVAQILNASDCFVLPSDWEGLPISVLEAMASGKPVIATDVGGLPELISPENGLLVPAGNCQQLTSAMIELCRAPDLAARMGARGRQIVEKRFHVREMARQYGELYLRILNDHPRLPSKMKTIASQPEA